jgi:quercetin dioxygenase-like cupin family protein
MTLDGLEQLLTQHFPKETWRDGKRWRPKVNLVRYADDFIIISGIRRKTLSFGQKTLMTAFRLRKGSVLPRHSHPHEQTGYLVKGHILLIIGLEEYEARAGDSWCIPGGVEHGADILEDSVAIEVFSPVRHDYLPRPAI